MNLRRIQLLLDQALLEVQLSAPWIPRVFTIMLAVVVLVRLILRGLSKALDPSTTRAVFATSTSFDEPGLAPWWVFELSLFQGLTRGIHWWATASLFSILLVGVLILRVNHRRRYPSLSTPIAHTPPLRNRVALLLAVYGPLMLAICGLDTYLQALAPGWLFSPFAVWWWRAVETSDLASVIGHVCPHRGGDMCLSGAAWSTLSGGTLSPRDKAQVKVVEAGARAAQSRGLAVAILARNVVDSVEPLRENVEALVPFFKEVAVVIFENDSRDGTRAAFHEWVHDLDRSGQRIITPTTDREPASKGKYRVDVIPCDGEETDGTCKLGDTHRYAAGGGVGKMAAYRNKVLDFILEQPVYQDYGHMLVTDVDLAVSVSPLGILHSLGVRPGHPTAATGRMLIPGSLGLASFPYDYNAFDPAPRPDTRILDGAHKWLAELEPVGSLWRSNCDPVSPFKLAVAIGLDAYHNSLPIPTPYRVRSAFHGAALYPLDLVRSSGARYDTGEDGQRCEHIGFHRGLTHGESGEAHGEAMYVNPHWTLRLAVTRPAGAGGDDLNGIVGGIGIKVVVIVVCLYLVGGAVHTCVGITVTALAWGVSRVVHGRIAGQVVNAGRGHNFLPSGKGGGRRGEVEMSGLSGRGFGRQKN